MTLCRCKRMLGKQWRMQSQVYQCTGKSSLFVPRPRVVTVQGRQNMCWYVVGSMLFRPCSDLVPEFGSRRRALEWTYVFNGARTNTWAPYPNRRSTTKGSTLISNTGSRAHGAHIRVGEGKTKYLVAHFIVLRYGPGLGRGTCRGTC
jgi:hypothetical protein